MVSVIVPVYNCIMTLERCVRAIQKQSFMDWELLLVDDGSIDGSGKLCDSLASEDIRIRVFHKSNGGVSSARNMGLDHARGKYVMFCDSDDWVEPEWCEKLYLTAEKYCGCQPICNYYYNSVDLESINREVECGNLRDNIEKIDFFSLNHYELLGIPWNKIYARTILEDNFIRFRQGLSLGEDMIFNLDYLHCQTGGYIFVNEPLYHYVIENTNSLSSKYYPDLSGIYRMIYLRIKDELECMPGAYEMWENEYMHSYFYAYDRVFRNTWSKDNNDMLLRKWLYNVKQFQSEEFQSIKKYIKKSDINILQFEGLRTNHFGIYWVSVIVSEIISCMCHHK